MSYFAQCLRGKVIKWRKQKMTKNLLNLAGEFYLNGSPIDRDGSRYNVPSFASVARVDDCYGDCDCDCSSDCSMDCNYDCNDCD